MTSNDGIMGYIEVYKWFTETTGLAMTERMKTIMTPTPPKKEEDIADAIAKWNEQCKAVEEMGASHILPETFRKIALKSLMIGRGKEYYETMEETAGTKYEYLLKKCKEYAAVKSKDVDMGNVEEDKWMGRMA